MWSCKEEQDGVEHPWETEEGAGKEEQLVCDLEAREESPTSNAEGCHVNKVYHRVAKHEKS